MQPKEKGTGHLNYALVMELNVEESWIHHMIVDTATDASAPSIPSVGGYYTVLVPVLVNGLIS